MSYPSNILLVLFDNPGNRYKFLAVANYYSLAGSTYTYNINSLVYIWDSSMKTFGVRVRDRIRVRVRVRVRVGVYTSNL